MGAKKLTPNIYSLYELIHTGGVPIWKHIKDEYFDNYTQAEQYLLKLTTRTAMIIKYGWDKNGYKIVVGTRGYKT